MKTGMAKEKIVMTRRLTRGHSNLRLIVLAFFFGTWLVACGTEPSTSPGRQMNGARTLDLPAITKGDGTEAQRAQAEVFKGACDITATVEAFRTALGTLNPNQPGSFGSGRREINWDAVPGQLTNTDNFPADFFNQPVFPRARGAVFSTPGTGFRVSDDNFKGLNSTYEDEFNFFSPVRTFIAVGSNVTSVQFFVPGSVTPATSTGFGVVFSDVDHLGSAMLRLFDASGRSLGTYLAPACPQGFSFIGVKFPDAIVSSVEIVSGHAALGPASFDVSSRDHAPAHDLVIMDDFLYGEPIESSAGTKIGQAIPLGSGRTTPGRPGYEPAFMDGQEVTINAILVPPRAPEVAQADFFLVVYPIGFERLGIGTPQCNPCDHFGDGIDFTDFHDHVLDSSKRSPLRHVFLVVPAYSGEAEHDAEITTAYAAHIPAKSVDRVEDLLGTRLTDGSPVAVKIDAKFYLLASVVSANAAS